MIRTHGDFVPAGESSWYSHSQQVHRASADPAAARAAAEQGSFNQGVRWVGEVERGVDAHAGHAWMPNRRVIRPKEAVEEVSLTKEDLRRDYVVALREVGGEKGVDALIHRMAGALTQRAQRITTLRMRVQKAFDNADVDQVSRLAYTA